jgi:uncharacterized protein (DUF1800 family)
MSHRPLAFVLGLATTAPLATGEAPSVRQAASARQTPTAPSALSPRDSAFHVLNRLAYGPTPGLVDRIAREGVMRWVDRQLAVDGPDDPNLKDVLAPFDLLRTSPEDLLRSYVLVQRERRADRRSAAADSMMSLEERRRRMPEEGRELRALGAQLPELVVVRGVGSDRQLAEVMADFWSNHFNVFVGKNLDRVYLPDYIEHTIRPRVFGSFEDLLIATAKSPAMMIYLDNAQSIAPGARPPEPERLARQRMQPIGRGIRGRPGRFPTPMFPMPPGGGGSDSARRLAQQRRPTGLNENYARELMELHTLGVDGGYTQKDVTEVARVLTGWSVRPPPLGGGFVFNDWAHDRGEKTVLGQAFPAGHGEDEGMRLLRTLAEHPSTMHFVSGKLCARFVSDTPPDGCVDDAVMAWKRSGGNLREVLRAIFHSPDFWAASNIGTKVKTPLEFVVSAVRAVGGASDTTLRLANAVARLGEPLYQHVAPNGYPEHQEDWVNSGALLNRMNLAIALAANRLPGVTVNLDLDGVLPLVDDHEALVQSVDRTILGGKMSVQTRKVILEQLAEVKDPVQARALAVGLALGGPEFQRQ